MDLAARAAFDTDDGRIILARLSGEIKAQRFVLPSADTLERIGLAGRARARRLSAQALNDALGDERKKALEALLEHDPGIGRSRLTWLRHAALFHLLGLSFAPRPRDFPDRRLACFGRPER